MASAASASLRYRPGYVARPSSTSAFPVTMPALPTLPTLAPIQGDAGAPGYASRQILSGRLAALPGQQSATLTGVKAGAQQRLAGYGGYVWGVDDPSTPQDESLLLSYDATKGMGQREKSAGAGARDASNSRNTLYSSFANQNIASAIQRMTLEGQAIANQYAADVNRVTSGYADTAAGIVGDWTGLYGSDSAWLLDHPPPTPAAPDPATNPAAPPARSMTYSDFLRGRKSTPALAHEWDATYNYGRRFGSA